MSSTFEIFAPAKINLMLQVLGRRNDGYHDLQSLMAALTVGDRLTFQLVEMEKSRVGGRQASAWPRREACAQHQRRRLRSQKATPPLRISCDHPAVPTGDDSLLARAFRFAASRLDYPGGLEVRLEKKIPIGAGLGGGSSDAAAVMQAVERLTGRTLPVDAYPEIAQKLGADIPFFMDAATRGQWVAGIGELLAPCALPGDISFLLVNPGISISTKSVYQGLPPQLTPSKPAARVPPSLETVKALLPYVANDLESVVQGQYPVIAALKARLLELGADAALMSGSGSTVFGLYSQKNVRDDALGDLKAENPAMWVQGAELLAENRTRA